MFLLRISPNRGSYKAKLNNNLFIILNLLNKLFVRILPSDLTKSKNSHAFQEIVQTTIDENNFKEQFCTSKKESVQILGRSVSKK